MKTTKLAIYTVLTGEKEVLGNPISRLLSAYSDLELDFYCFTDNSSLKSEIWTCKLFDTRFLPPEKSSRRPKTLPHLYLPDYDYSLYIDNLCELKRLPTKSDLKRIDEQNYVYRLFAHSTRVNLIQESIAISSLGYDDANTLISQLESYSEHLPPSQIAPLFTCTVLLREHNNQEIIDHGNLWWEHILNFSKRDQMSFDFCRIVKNLKVNPLRGTKFDNDLIFEHNNAGNNRQLASFDQKAFQRELKKCRAHEYPPDDRAEIIKKLADLSIREPSDMEMLAYLFGSSFGAFHFPKRKIAASLQRMLSPLKGKIQTSLGVYNPSAVHGYQYTESDAICCQKSISCFVGATENVFCHDNKLETELSKEGALLITVYNSDSNSEKLVNVAIELNYRSIGSVWLLKLSIDNQSLTKFV